MFQLKKNTPRWVIVIFDLLIHLFALFFAYLIRFDLKADFSLIQTEWAILSKALWFYVLIKVGVFAIFQIHQGIVRHSSSADFKRIIVAELSSTLLFILGSMVRFYHLDGFYLFPNSVLLMEFIFSAAFVITGRFAVKLFYLEYIKEKGQEEAILIYGAGASGQLTKRLIEQDAANLQHIVGFLDDNPALQGKRIEGTRVYAVSDLQKLKETKEVKTLIIAIQELAQPRLKAVSDHALDLHIEIKRVPEAKTWVNGAFEVKRLQKIDINSLLGRPVIAVDNPKLATHFQHKTILVTGAAGSIGSGLTKALLKQQTAALILLDQAESALFELEQQLKNSHPLANITYIIGDICDAQRMQMLFEWHKPQIVFHAAAYKHVPLMEANPSEAVRNNTGGTQILADFAAKYNCEQFIMISTDKAVNPTNVMGATKRSAEMVVSALNSTSKTNFITTRFGNVLGSNGSVIPIFEKQIANGGPITLTDEHITRFFMTIPEACELVLQAATMGNGGEIFVFDMGEPVKILDLAKKMIQLSGLRPYQDIAIQITGLRPGEKRYEEVLANAENTLPTYHPQILIAKTRSAQPEQQELIQQLLTTAAKQDNEATVSMLKQLIPEYISNNSIYQKLDK
ncbi:MAG: polysaccharide biosynthesis protein [Flavobacteriales bacterium]